MTAKKIAAMLVSPLLQVEAALKNLEDKELIEPSSTAPAKIKVA